MGGMGGARSPPCTSEERELALRRRLLREGAEPLLLGEGPEAFPDLMHLGLVILGILVGPRGVPVGQQTGVLVHGDVGAPPRDVVGDLIARLERPSRGDRELPGGRHRPRAGPDALAVGFDRVLQGLGAGGETRRDGGGSGGAWAGPGGVGVGAKRRGGTRWAAKSASQRSTRARASAPRPSRRARTISSISRRWKGSRPRERKAEPFKSRRPLASRRA